MSKTERFNEVQKITRVFASKIAEQPDSFDELLEMVKDFSDEILQKIANGNPKTSVGVDLVSEDPESQQSGSAQNMGKVCLANVRPRGRP